MMLEIEENLASEKLNYYHISFLELGLIWFYFITIKRKVNTNTHNLNVVLSALLTEGLYCISLHVYVN